MGPSPTIGLSLALHCPHLTGSSPRHRSGKTRGVPVPKPLTPVSTENSHSGQLIESGSPFSLHHVNGLGGEGGGRREEGGKAWLTTGSRETWPVLSPRSEPGLEGILHRPTGLDTSPLPSPRRLPVGTPQEAKRVFH